MTVYDIMDLFIDDQEFELYDLELNKVVYKGTWGELKFDDENDYQNREIMSIDNIGKFYGNNVTLNI